MPPFLSPEIQRRPEFLYENSAKIHIDLCVTGDGGHMMQTIDWLHFRPFVPAKLLGYRQIFAQGFILLIPEKCRPLRRIEILEQA